MDETKEILTSILHQLELMNTKLESLDSRMGSLDGKMKSIDSRMQPLEERPGRIESDIKFRATLLMHKKILTDHNHRIADIEQEIRISKQ